MFHRPLLGFLMLPDISGVASLRIIDLVDDLIALSPTPHGIRAAELKSIDRWWKTMDCEDNSHGNYSYHRPNYRLMRQKRPE
jgi:hypothetical protein